MSEIRLAIVDDHKLFRKGMISILGYYPDLKVEFEAEDGQFLLELLKEHSVDVVIMDYRMQKMNGPETTELLRKRFPKIKVLALSMFNDTEHILAMLNAGVNGYMQKDSDPDEIYKAILGVHENEMYYTPTVLKAVTDSLKNQNKNTNPVVTRSATEITDKEAMFLGLLCKELSHKEIAVIMCVSERTIDGYRDKLCEKLKVKNKGTHKN